MSSNEVMVNGRPQNVNFEENWSLDQLVSELRDQISDEKQIVTSIKVNGLELMDAHQAGLLDFQIKALSQIEIKTEERRDHIREVGEDIVRILGDYIPHLVRLSLAVAQFKNGIHSHEFRKLTEGMEIIVNTLQTFKVGVGISLESPARVLEAELKSIFKELISAQETKNETMVQDILEKQIPEHLDHWLKEGIPALKNSISNTKTA